MVSDFVIHRLKIDMHPSKRYPEMSTEFRGYIRTEGKYEAALQGIPQ